MEKGKIKSFAINARNELIRDITQRLENYGIDKDGVKSELDISTPEIKYYTSEHFGLSGSQIKWRHKVVNELKRQANEVDWQQAFTDLVEEVAYTWFNRIIAIRFMEVNDYLPTRTRVLSSEEGRSEPDILIHALELEEDFGHYSDEEREIITRALDTLAPHDLDQMYEIMFIKQSDALQQVLPHLFELTADYMKLLFTPRYNRGVIKELLTEIPESYFDVAQEGQVEVIGWLYQYYNTEPKDLAFKKKKYSTSDIPAVTQLFTPDWIVKYMVENSLGRYWISVLHAKGDTRSAEEIAQNYGWNYYMPAASQNKNLQVTSQQKKLSEVKVEDITLIDPAIGSGHILVYAFDVFMQLYETEGFSRRIAASEILKKNIFGLDVDTRAYQLAYFALMMKAREFDRRFFQRSIELQLIDVPTTNLSIDDFKNISADGALKDQLTLLLTMFRYGNDLGSIIKIPKDINLNQLELFTKKNDQRLENQITLDEIELEKHQQELAYILKTAKILQSSYTIGISNPPYMGHGKMNEVLKKYVDKNYQQSKSDICTVFIESLINLVEENGYLAMITQHSWMFLSSFEQLRQYLQNKTLVNMAHLGTRAFEEIGGEVVQTTTFIIQNSMNKDYVGTYERLISFDSQQAKETAYLEMIVNPESDLIYRTNQTNYMKIPGSPIAYWVSNQLINSFEQGGSLGQLAEPRQGMATSDNNRFLRQWSEVSFKNIAFDIRNRDEASQSGYTWFPYSKGGHFRKWFGNNELVVNWKNDGEEVRALATKLYKNDTRTIKNMRYYFRSGLSWSALSSGDISFRYVPHGFLFDTKGPLLFIDDNSNKASYLFLLGLLNSKTSMAFLKILAPTMDYNQGPIRSIPMPKTVPDGQASGVNDAAKLNIKLAKKDWDVTEKSWGFGGHPLITHIAEHKQNWTIQEAYSAWEKEADDRFNQLKANEEELNRIFIDLYGLQDELTPEEDDKDVSVRRADRERDIKSFLSYFIGCVFGRYSLDVEGLAFAGGDWNDDKYHSFHPNEDNIILLTDSEYFDDRRDIINRLREFLTTTFGKNNLDENMQFIAESLDEKKSQKGVAAEDIIRTYFLNDFYKDHDQIYQKRPIYWEFNSGRNKGFKALMYLHRYDSDDLAMVRGYLHDLQSAYEQTIAVRNQQIEIESDTRTKNGLKKEVVKIQKQIDELVKYDEALQHQSMNSIELDLDDGVLVNHAKLQGQEKLLTKL